MNKISVVVPVYNVRKYVERCVDSLLKQSYSDIEVLLIDNGSTDGCSEIIDYLACSNERIKAYHLEEKGVSRARNVGKYSSDRDTLRVECKSAVFHADFLLLRLSRFGNSTGLDASS